MHSIESHSVAIIILNWNGYAHTRNCLNSLHKIDQRSFQVILVDNASSGDDVVKLKEEFPQAIYLVNDENLGFTGGNNVGIQYALENGFSYIMLLNNDTEVGPDFLSPLASTLRDCGNLGAVQPLMYLLHDRNKVWNAGGKFNSWTGGSLSITKVQKQSAPYQTDWITGCCILVKSSVIKEIGLLNDHYFAYFEDVDWSLRMRRHGYSLAVVPSSIIYHEAGASSKAKEKGKEGKVSAFVHYLYSRNQLFQIRNHLLFPKHLIAWFFQLSKLAAFWAYFLARGRAEKRGAVAKGIYEGMFTKNIKWNL